jgi:two-component sensor histidine kinase
VPVPARSSTTPLWEPSPLPIARGCRAWALTHPHHLATARRGARDELRRSRDDLPAETADEIVMVLDELATNAFIHGAPPALVELCRHPEGWLVIATDAAPGTVPVPTADRPPEDGGMGLRMVAELTVRHGTDSDARTKRVWALVAC